MASKQHVLMAGGGTAGHVFPGLAVATELHGRGWRVSWVGRAGGMEQELIERRDLDFHPLPAEAVVGRGPLARLGAVMTLCRSTLAARRLLRSEDARVVLGTGGYVSVPAVLGARLAGRPTVLLEPNARAGAANRFLSRWSRAAAIAYEGASRDFRCPVHLTGVPVRPEFFDIPGAPAESSRVLVLGGSQGALKLNLLLPAAFERLAPRVPGLEILHQVGRHLDATRKAYAARDLSGAAVEIVSFIEDMAGAMAGSNLIISRAGAVTLAEVCAAGRPAVLIPLELAGGHQRENAQALVEAGGARIVDQTAPVERTAAVMEELLRDRRRLTEMGSALSGVAQRDAARRIADLLVAAATEPGG